MNRKIRTTNMSDWIQRLTADLGDMHLSSRERGDISELIATAKACTEFEAPDKYRGALPADEDPWEVVILRNVAPVPCSAVDGSQIYPDFAEPVLWAYVHAMLTHPAGYVSKLLTPDMLSGKRGYFGRQYIDAIRRSMELNLAASAASQYPNTLVLLDGPLLSPGRSHDEKEGLAKSMLDDALALLDSTDGLLAGVVSDGHARYLSTLLLVMAGEKLSTTIRDVRVVRALLEHDQRTRLFYRNALDNRRVYFFYLRYGHSIFRVETPIQHTNETLDLIATSVMENIRRGMTGYPVALSAAHHLANIKEEVAKHLKAMVRSQVGDSVSAKSIAKEIHG